MPAYAQSAHSVSARISPRMSSETNADQQCLTAAIYYESAREPLAGQEAVAQVILNRTRQSGYPRTVCGVVWQGHERATGCQFTFTCDGSLSRRPNLTLWNNAAAVAQRMLSTGSTALDLPTAERSGPILNYHATYVQPAWRRGLVESARIGNHIFYARKSSGGAPLRAARPAIAAPLSPSGPSVWGISLADATRTSPATP
jgi:spore germination cell wall hydrolase CwlJ-like protein